MEKENREIRVKLGEREEVQKTHMGSRCRGQCPVPVCGSAAGFAVLGGMAAPWHDLLGLRSKW